MSLIENPYYCDFLITPTCNFNCSFCSAASDKKKPKVNQLSLSSITKALHELDELDVLRVSFEGGEPFLRKDIFEILSVADELDFLYYINTNGSLISDEIAEKLSHTNVSKICISIDGPNSIIHDHCRGYVGAFEKMVKAVHSLQKYDVPIQAIITLSRSNYKYFYDTLDCIKNLGLTSASVMLLASVGSASTDLITPFDDWSNLLIKLSEDKLSGSLPVDLRIVTTGESSFPWELHVPLLKRERLDLLGAWIDPNNSEPFSSNSFGCTAGRSSMAIDGYGNVYGCSLMVSQPEFCAGNIEDNSLVEIWNNSTVFGDMRKATLEKIEGPCKDCEHLYDCKGGCRACSSSCSKSKFGSDLRCEIAKEIATA
ncbi:radical SAM/SPASM domain-containing protein [Reinekea sp. G2M2-21]|uniref:radical SAM/SPASM domain-containing protein n=1 Tax=Reinekea sp. G2M2-21 TaxID=2788942 RepID=UPI0018AB1479|nr:radical SAM protein [Reinekea sp. G2M2-21]